MAIDLKQRVIDVPDFPTPGIGFKDIMPLLGDAEALREAVDRLGEWGSARSPDVVVGGEARGFFIGAAVAYKLGCGFVPARRPGKLPRATVRKEYALEYGSNVLEVHRDAIGAGARVLIHDDVLATGGTGKAMIELVEELGGEVVGLAFIIELSFLNGRQALGGHDVYALVEY
jgi:adenine phosphoribosyltransferase